MDMNQLAVEVFNKCANDYQAKFMNVDLYGDTFQFLCEQIHQPNAQILDVACGPGNIAAYLLKQRPDFQLLGIDLAPNMIKLAQQNNPTATFRVMDVRAIATLEARFQAIVSGFCLPYLSKEEAFQFIENAAQLLYPQGLIYISTMENDYTESGLKTGSTGDSLFMYYHQADYLIPSLEKHGFQILYSTYKEYIHNDEPTKDLILIGQLK